MNKDVSTEGLQVTYMCPVCEEVYTDYRQAEECLARGIETNGWGTGTWVLCPHDWHGWCKDDEWIAYSCRGKADAESHFDRASHYFAWYIITAVSRLRGKHRAGIHIATGAFSAGKEPLRCGWTIPFRRHEHQPYSISHYELYRPDEIHLSAMAENGWFDGITLPDKPLYNKVLEKGEQAVAQGLTGPLL